MTRLLPLHNTLRDQFEKLGPVYDSEEQLREEQQD